MIAFCDHRYILSKGSLGVFEVFLQSCDILFMHVLVIGLPETYLPSQELNLTMRKILYSCNLLLFSVSPYAIEILKQLIHEDLRYSTGTSVAEIMCYFERFFRDPIFSFTLEIFKG